MMPMIRLDIIGVDTFKRYVFMSKKVWEMFPEVYSHLIGITCCEWLNDIVRKYDRTGTLRRSIRYQIRGPLQKKIHVWPDIYYAKYVDKGTRPSPGRYVPWIGYELRPEKYKRYTKYYWRSRHHQGKRLKRPSKHNPRIGWHPGFKGKHFMTELSKKVSTQLKTRVIVPLLFAIDVDLKHSQTFKGIPLTLKRRWEEIKSSSYYRGAIGQ